MGGKGGKGGNGREVKRGRGVCAEAWMTLDLEAVVRFEVIGYGVLGLEFGYELKRVVFCACAVGTGGDES